MQQVWLKAEAMKIQLQLKYVLWMNAGGRLNLEAISMMWPTLANLAGQYMVSYCPLSYQHKFKAFHNVAYYDWTKKMYSNTALKSGKSGSRSPHK